MAGVKCRGGKPGRSGVHTNHANAGRPPKSVKALARLYESIKAAAAKYSDVSECDVDVSLSYCPRCGAWGWESGSASVWGTDFGQVPGATPLGSVPVDRQQIKHSKSCSANRGV